jgi:hypothetical protein
MDRPEPTLWVHAASGSTAGPYYFEDDAVREGRRLTSGPFTVWNARTDSPVSYHRPESEK